MKKEKIVMAITVGISAFILVSIMFMQFKVVEQTDLTSIETMTESELRSELITWREKCEELELKHEDIVNKLEEYKEEYKSDEETKNLLENELKGIQMLLGETDVKGQGIIITINEEQIENDSITYEDLLYIVNDLKGAGAEAISINDQRIINRTDIVYTNVLKVNGKRIWAPFTIKAIGNQTYLESAILGKGGHVDALKELGHEISIDKAKKVKIDKYPNDISTKYIK